MTRYLLRSFRSAASLWLAVVVGVLPALVLRGQQKPLQIATPPALSSVGAVRALSMVEARKGLSVRIRGVVTYYEPRWDTLFVQDETGGLYIFPSGHGRPRYHHGQVLELTGRTFGNSHGNSLVEEVVTEVGTGPLPESRAITYPELQRGGYDSQWVEIRGVVRAISAEFQRVVVDIDAGGRFQAHLPRPSAEPLPLSILHSRVLVRGVAGTVLNQNEEIVGARLFVPAFNSFTVLQEGVTEPFSLPIQPLAEFQAPDAAQPAKRTHVRGVVSLRWPTGKVFIQEEGRGLEIEVIQARKFNDPEGSFHPVASPVAFEVGDRIDAVGYPANRKSKPVLEEADVRVVAPAVGIRADPLQPSLALDARKGARLVEVHASFIEQIPPDDESGPSVRRYLCEADNLRFEARLTGAQPLKTTLLPGSRLKVTGVIEVRPNLTSPTGGFLLWMRSPADLENLGAPPNWKTREMVRILVVVGLAALVGVGWIALLRRQVSQRTAQLRDANEKLHQALTEERELRQLKSNFVSLVSHEFRTPLGIIMSSGEILEHYHEQLDPESRREQLQSINRSVRRMADMMNEVLLLGKVEADGLEFKPAPLELQSFCERIRDEIIAATNHSCPILLNIRELATTVSADEVVLGHIFTNLLSNAVKYSPPGSPVNFTVRRSNGFAVFQIEDRGCGIPPEDEQRLFEAFHRGHNVRQIPGTGLGMVIVKRCVDLHGGTIEVDSKVGVGSRFIVKLPLFNIPSQYIARLRRAASIGGNVVDPSGRPVHGAKITVHLTDSVLNTTPPEVPVAGVEAESDETGAWQTSRVAPELVRRLNIYANHPDYARSPNLYPGTDPQLERQLLDKTLVLRLGMAAAVFGQVVDSDGAPIEGAAILVGRRWYPDARKAKTAVDGSFSVAGCASGHTLITAEAEGFAPKTMAVKVSEDSAPVRIALTAGKELSVKVVDRNGDPVSKAYVSLSAPLAVEANADSGTLVPQFSFDARADAEGRCMFPNVPEVELELYVGADGFMEQRGHRLDLSIPRLTVTLRPAVTVLGSVRDSATGKPLPKFRIVTGCPDQDGVHWSTIDRFHLNFQGGAFCHTYTESVVGVGQNSGYFLRFEAHGYQPCVSRLIAPSEEMVQLDVALQPAALRQFVVLSPEGKPVSGADVVVVSRLERPIGLVPGGFDRRYERSDGALRCTDESGQVALAADDEIKPVIIACPAGYAEIDTGNLPDESTLQLQPWGRIEGVLSSEAQAAGCEIQFDFDRTRRAEIFVDVSTAFRAKPDVTGQFAFPLVPPGRHRLWEALPGPAFSLVNGIDLEVHAGQTTAVNTQSKQVPLNGLLKAGE